MHNSKCITNWMVMLLLLTLVATAEPPTKEKPKQFKGFVLQTGDKSTDVLQGPVSLVMENPEQLASFTARIPEQLPHKKRPAPPNPDPLLKDFKLDFSKEIMVIVVHHDTISAYPKYQGVEESGEVRVVNFDIPGRPAEARPFGWSVYAAVVLPKVAVPTELKFTSVPSEW